MILLIMGYDMGFNYDIIMGYDTIIIMIIINNICIDITITIKV